MTREESDDIQGEPLTLQITDELGIRRHGVNLERCQRIHLDIDSEPMEFTAMTLAAMIQDIADQCDEHEAFLLHSVVRALKGKDEHHRLVLQKKRPGKFRSPTETEAQHYQDMGWLYTLANREKLGLKTEAAVAEIAEHWNVSRATVFAGIRRAEYFCETQAMIFANIRGAHVHPNPRPAKKRDA